jgi:hypothetical protein
MRERRVVGLRPRRAVELSESSEDKHQLQLGSRTKDEYLKPVRDEYARALY